MIADDKHFRARIRAAQPYWRGLAGAEQGIFCRTGGIIQELLH